jgi:hypothetical protein
VKQSNDPGPKIGWELTNWTGRPQVCSVGPCAREVNAGHVRVDRPAPWLGDPVICVDCWFKIMIGIDPDPDAETPQWEVDRRAQALDSPEG